MRLSQWKRRGVPHDVVLRVAEATGWVVRPHEIRPDLYPHPDDGLPAHLRIPAHARCGAVGCV